MDIKVDLLQQVKNVLVKRFQAKQLKMKLFLVKNQLKNCSNQLLENCEKGKTYSSSFSTDLVDMDLLNKFNKRFRFLQEISMRYFFKILKKDYNY